MEHKNPQSFYLSVVIPCYNEEKRIGKTLRRLHEYFLEYPHPAEVIVVDDGSFDGTPQILESCLKKWQSVQGGANLRVVTHLKNTGKGYAVREGMLVAWGKYVLFSDADLSTPIEEFTKFEKHFNNGHQVVIGSRSLPDSDVLARHPVRNMMGRIFNKVVRLFTGLPFHDTQCGFKCFTQEAAQKIFSRLKLTDFSFDVEALYLAKILGLKVKEAPIRWVNAPDSKVRMFRDSTRMLIDLLQIRWIHRKTKPLSE